MIHALSSVVTTISSLGEVSLENKRMLSKNRYVSVLDLERELIWEIVKGLWEILLQLGLVYHFSSAVNTM